MDLHIDTTGAEVVVTAREGERIVGERRFSGERREAEMLLPAIEGLLSEIGVGFKDIHNVRAAGEGGRFTSLRIGVATANALAYAIARLRGERFDQARLQQPVYGGEPNISANKPKL